MFEPLLRIIGRLGAALGRGALAGAAATAAMTLSTAIEMRLREREPSNTPAAAAGKALGVQPRSPEGGARFGTLVHWGYGTAWGAAGGLLRQGLAEPLASVAHFGLVWGTEVILLPAMDVVAPLPEWPAEEVAVDVWHHLVYVISFAAVWAALEQAARPSSSVERIVERLGAAGSWISRRLAG